MTNEVANPQATGLGALNALKTGLANVRTKMPESAGGSFLRLLTDGDWVFGQEDNAVSKGTEVVLNPMSIKHGYVSWPERKQSPNGAKRPRETMVGLGVELPPVHTLDSQDPTDDNTVYRPWTDQIAFDVKILDGKHKGTQVTYKTNSVGGMNGARDVLDAILAKLGEDSAYVCPVISLGTDNYKHAEYGKTYVPVFKIVGWMDLDGNEEGEEPKAVENKKSAKAAEPEPTPEPEPEPEQEPETAEAAPEEAPVRRRRRA